MVLRGQEKRPRTAQWSAGAPRISERIWSVVRIAVHVGALVPLALLGWAWAAGRLGFNPIREITLRTGRAALLMLVLSLACTPARMLTGLAPIQRLRKPLGLYAFLYAALHFLTYVGLDFRFNVAFLWPDISQQPFIQIGLLTFLILLVLALTSTRAWVKRIGRSWKRLHSLVYAAVVLAILHFFLLVKGDWRRPLGYAIVVALLLLLRLPVVRKAWRRLRARVS
jgi:sulfoxide reductase heme-binding subunit YedZ